MIGSHKVAARLGSAYGHEEGRRRNSEARAGRMLKTLISILAGLVAGVPVVAIVARIGHILYPPPQGMDLTDCNVVAAMIAQMPVGALLFVVAGWVLGALVAPQQ